MLIFCKVGGTPVACYVTTLAYRNRLTAIIAPPVEFMHNLQVNAIVYMNGSSR